VRRRPVAFDPEQVAARALGVVDAEVDAKARAAHVSDDLEAQAGEGFGQLHLEGLFDVAEGTERRVGGAVLGVDQAALQ
jgi:hypothetical protein